MTINEYKEWLIHEIIEIVGDRFTYNELKRKSISTLERIYDNC